MNENLSVCICRINVGRHFSWSYGLAWAGVALAILATILFCYTGKQVKTKKKKVFSFGAYPAPSTSSMMPLEYGQGT